MSENEIGKRINELRNSISKNRDNFNSMSLEDRLTLIEGDLDSLDSKIQSLHEVGSNVNLNLEKIERKLNYVLGWLAGIAIAIWLLR